MGSIDEQAELGSGQIISLYDLTPIRGLGGIYPWVRNLAAVCTPTGETTVVLTNRFGILTITPSKNFKIEDFRSKMTSNPFVNKHIVEGFIILP